MHVTKFSLYNLFLFCAFFGMLLFFKLDSFAYTIPSNDTYPSTTVSYSIRDYNFNPDNDGVVKVCYYVTSFSNDSSRSSIQMFVSVDNGVNSPTSIPSSYRVLYYSNGSLTNISNYTYFNLTGIYNDTVDGVVYSYFVPTSYTCATSDVPFFSSYLNAPIFNDLQSAKDYLFGFSSADYPDFSGYTFSQYMDVFSYGYPFGYRFDAGIDLFSYMKYKVDGYTSVSNKVLVNICGVNGSDFLVLDCDEFTHDFKSYVDISDFIVSDSFLYVSFTPFDTESLFYGPTLICEYEISGSLIGRIIRSFGSDTSNNYYNSTLNVNGTSRQIDYVVSNSSYKVNFPPNSNNYDYDYFFNNTQNRYDYSSQYSPVFNDYTDLTENDYDYISNNYVDDSINNIEINVDTDFVFDVSFGDVSFNDVQGVYDDSVSVFKFVGSMLAVLSTMLGLLFPFLPFNLPGIVLALSGILIGGVVVGIFIKIFNFIRGR